MRFLQKVTHASKRSLYRFVVATLSVLLVSGFFWMSQQHVSATRFQLRSVYINSSLPGDTTFYIVSFRYPTVNAVGSIGMQFCTEAIASLPCDPPVGLDVSSAALVSQTGETGFTLTQQTQNTMVISRPPVTTGITQGTYKFDNIVNPTGDPQTYYIRLNSYASTDASGSFIDYGSVATTTTQEVDIVTQVPPYLIFCAAKQIPADCMDPRGPNYEEFDDPTSEEALSTQSEMLAYTNARNGLSIVLTGRSLTSGIYEIPAITGNPEESLPGKGQFGINLTANTEPDIGADPVGPGTNTLLNSDYTQSNRFLFNDGDTLVTSNGVTKRRKFTVSYVINVPPDQHPGIYSTTVTFICTGSF